MRLTVFLCALALTALSLPIGLTVLVGSLAATQPRRSRVPLMCLMLLALCGTPSRSIADGDLDGRWLVTFDPDLGPAIDPVWKITQGGTLLTAPFFGSGMVDATGHFILHFDPFLGYCEESGTLSGTVTASDQLAGSAIVHYYDDLTCDPGGHCGEFPDCYYSGYGVDVVGVRIDQCVQVSGCRVAKKSVLSLKNAATSKDRLMWKWLKGTAISIPDLGAPTSTTNYTLCVYAGNAVASVALPAGLSWQSVGMTEFKFRDPSGASRALLKSGDAGKTKASVKGKADYLLDTLVPMLTLPVTVQLVNDANSVCYEAVYDAPQVIKNVSGQFKAKAQ